MDTEESTPEFYEKHDGTIRVSGNSNITKTALYANHIFSQGVRNFDFLYIGANAGHQASKVVRRFTELIEKGTDNVFTVIATIHVTTVNAEEGAVFGSFWQCHVVAVEDYLRIIQIDSTDEKT